MKHPLLPDFDFDTYKDITPEFLKSIEKTCVLCDIDNTLVPYDEPNPTDDVCAWVKTITDAGIKLILVSNNEKERVEKFNEKLNLPYLYKSGKPSRRTVKNALRILNGQKKNAVMVGDQLLTDVITARVSGITSIWVPTIKKVETPFFRFKSAIEKPFIKHYYKKKAKKII
ncbi:MAG: YqeG family HAD IIIA-type phosphatase [Clostridia bacterium]|nr:YqeG family HAD IIIA-type phosphatase [Clostridia bacterium]